MKTNPYFYTNKGNFEIFWKLSEWDDITHLMFVRHLESGKLYLGSVCYESLDRYSSISLTYILAPITKEEYQELVEQKMEADIPFLQTKEKGYKIIVQDEDEMDTISEFETSNNKYNHIPKHKFIRIQGDDLPFC